MKSQKGMVGREWDRCGDEFVEVVREMGPGKGDGTQEKESGKEGVI